MHSCVHFGARLVQKWQKCLQCLMQSTLGIVMARSHYSSDGLVIFVVKEMVKKWYFSHLERILAKVKSEERKNNSPSLS